MHEVEAYLNRVSPALRKRNKELDKRLAADPEFANLTRKPRKRRTSV